MTQQNGLFIINKGANHGGIVKSLVFLTAISVCAFGYGYWDIFDYGGRVISLSPVSAALAGATLPDGSSALSVFSNPAGLAGMNSSSVSLSGWGTGWREEIYYHYSCIDPYRFNIGAMSPRGSAAVAFPLGDGFTLGAGIATVAQYEMRATAKVYTEIRPGVRVVFKNLIAGGSGDLNEALLAFAGYAGSVRFGVSSGIRFGSGESTVYSNRADGEQFDSTYNYSWDASGFALRAGAETRLGYTSIYSTFISGDDRYESYAGAGGCASFPFLKGGFLGTELGIRDGSELVVSAYTRLPWLIPGSNGYIGITGYRPKGAIKNGMGISSGLDYTFDSNKVTMAYQWNCRYRDGCYVPVDCINWLYDSGESFIIGYERTF